jgi:glycolate oxidase FAD binding subunit
MIITPPTIDDAAAALAAEAQSGRRVVIRGGGTKSDWRMPAAVDSVVSTLALNRLVAHRHGDLTATIEAGARLIDVNRELAMHRQWLPLDPAWADLATIGGIVATNDAGPRRHRYGSPRDLIIGVEIVRVDGVRAKAGGIVVKNVAGYDLARLMTGSSGSLALIASATFKLYPLAAASRTVVADLPSHAAAAALVAAMNASQLTPSAVEIQTPPLRMLVRFESTAASVDAQSAAAAAIASSSGAEARVIAGEAEEREWRAHANRPWSGDGAVVKMTLLPGDLASALDLIQRTTNGAPFEVVGRAGLGVLLLRLEGESDDHTRVVAALRARVPIEKGSIAVLRGSAALRASAPSAAAGQVMHAVKQAFDPSGVLPRYEN